MTNLILISAIATLACALLALVYLRLSQAKQSIKTLQESITNERIQTQVLEAKNAELEKERERERALFQEQLTMLQTTHKESLALLEKKLQENYQTQNTLLLAQNKSMLHEDSKKILDEIFNPLKAQVKDYSERLTRNEAEIKTQIKSMFSFSQNLGQSADKLAQILKGDKKTRGNFGELQLKSILENSGLIEGEQYKLQHSIKSESLEGQKKYIPDAKVHLERNKSIIIDAKFSLPNSFDFEAIDAQVRQEVYQNLKSRIDELAEKAYPSLESDNYDFILLFIPYHNILDLALEANPNIYQYAYDKKVYLTTPHTLFMALKTINITWLNIKRNENVLQAFGEIDKFYSKFEGVLGTFEDVKTHLSRLQKSTETMDNQLQSGQGNLHSRFKKLGELGVKTQKALKDS